MTVKLLRVLVMHEVQKMPAEPREAQLCVNRAAELKQLFFFLFFFNFGFLLTLVQKILMYCGQQCEAQQCLELFNNLCSNTSCSNGLF